MSDLPSLCGMIRVLQPLITIQHVYIVFCVTINAKYNTIYTYYMIYIYIVFFTRLVLAVETVELTRHAMPHTYHGI